MASAELFPTWASSLAWASSAPSGTIAVVRALLAWVSKTRASLARHDPIFRQEIDMTRHWLTSTTALALVLNAAAPLPSSAYDSAAPDRAVPEMLSDVRLAENENSTAAQDLMSDVLGDASASASAAAC